MIKIRLERQADIKRFIKNILESCSLSTEKVDEIKVTKATANSHNHPSAAEDVPDQDASVFEEYEVYYRSAQKEKQEKTLQ